MECSICQNNVTDKVLMTCKYSHPFCFSCILTYVEKNEELKSCPTCRGGNKYIMIPLEPLDKSENDISSDNEDFSSLKYFQKSLSILQMVKKIEENSCLIPESVLLLYINNKEQLKLINEIISLRTDVSTIDSVTGKPDYEPTKEDFKKLVSLIKWKGVKFSTASNNSLVSEIMGNLVNNGSSLFGYTGQPTRSNNMSQGNNTRVSGNTTQYDTIPPMYYEEYSFFPRNNVTGNNGNLN